MKKAKVMLSAIAVIAVIGGALAFKASKTLTIGYYFCNSSSQCAYTTKLTKLITTAPLGNVTFITSGTVELDKNIVGSPCNNSLVPCTTTLYTTSQAD
jgi:hypothetical protein